jgi:hypothetical protein
MQEIYYTPIPTRCTMPDLVGIKPRLVSLVVAAALGGDVPKTRREDAYRRTFARLVDKAVRDYQLARQAMLADINEPKRSVHESEHDGHKIHIVAFANHCENAVNTITRSLRTFDRINGESIGNLLPRQLRRAMVARSRGIVKLRNAIEHVDELIQHGEVGEGRPVMIAVNADGDGMIVGYHELRFTDVARALRYLHEIGMLLFRLPPDSKPQDRSEKALEVRPADRVISLDCRAGISVTDGY